VLSKGNGAARLSFVTNVLTLMKNNSGTIAKADISTTDATGLHRLVATKSGAVVKLYIDGVDRTGAVTNRTITDTASALNIGRDKADSKYFAGLIDEVAVYNIALNAAQVQQHFKASGR
jgi:Concanavalin A-like lectin/glucanases superfamily